MNLSVKTDTGLNDTSSLNIISFSVIAARRLNASYLHLQLSWKGGLVHSRLHTDGLSNATWTN